MSTNTTASETPNVVVSNPKIRRIANVTLGVVGLVLGTALVVDGASADFDVSAVTTPALAGYLYLASAFGLTVITPNIPKK